MIDSFRLRGNFLLCVLCWPLYSLRGTMDNNDIIAETVAGMNMSSSHWGVPEFLWLDCPGHRTTIFCYTFFLSRTLTILIYSCMTLFLDFSSSANLSTVKFNITAWPFLWIVVAFDKIFAYILVVFHIHCKMLYLHAVFNLSNLEDLFTDCSSLYRIAQFQIRS